MAIHNRRKLYGCLETGNTESFKQFIQDANNDEINYRDEGGNTLLHASVKVGCVETVKILLQETRFSGQSINAKNTWGWTALHLAVDAINTDDISNHDRLDILKLLLVEPKFTAEKEKDERGRTAINLAGDNIIITNLLQIPFVFRRWIFELEDMWKLRSLDSFSQLQNQIIPILSCSRQKVLAPTKYIEDYLTKVGIDKKDAAMWKVALQSLRRCFSSYIESSTTHIHVVGPGKAGKSLSVQWLKDVLQSNGMSVSVWDRLVVPPLHKSVEHGRTRGVETHSVWTNDNQGQSLHFLVHDYGGQQEFLLHHPDSLSIAHSIYMVVIPMYEMQCDHKGRERTETEIQRDYEYWLKFIYSMVRKEVPTQAIIEETWDEVKNCSVYAETMLHGIPLITVLNKFSKVHGKGVSDEAVAHTSRILQQSLNAFGCTEISEQPLSTSQSGFIVPSAEPMLVNTNVRHGFHTMKQVLLDFAIAIQRNYGMQRSPSGDQMSSRSAILQYISDQLTTTWSDCSDSAPLRWLSSTDNWFRWLRSSISSYGAVKSALSSSMKLNSLNNMVLDILIRHCHDSLIAANVILVLDKELHGCTVITNPSVLTSVVMGDIFYFFHKQSASFSHLCTRCKLARSSKKVFGNHNNLKLLPENIQVIFEHVHQWYRNNYMQEITAYDLLRPFGGALQFPIIDLLVRMKLCLPINDDGSGRLKTWFIGLEPAKPKGDGWSSKQACTILTHTITRYFQLPNRRSIFFPGYFLRLFTFIHDTGPNFCDTWADAMYCMWYIYEPTSPVIEREVIVESYEFEGYDGFEVTVSFKARSPFYIADAAKNAFKEMNRIRAFIHRHMWGLRLNEYCVSVHSQRKVVSHYPLKEIQSQLFDINNTLSSATESCKFAVVLYFGLSTGLDGKYSCCDTVTDFKIPFDIIITDSTNEIESDIHAMAVSMQCPMDARQYIHALNDTQSNSRKILLKLLRAYFVRKYMEARPVHTQLSAMGIQERCRYEGVSIQEFNTLFAEKEDDTVYKMNESSSVDQRIEDNNLAKTGTTTGARHTAPEDVQAQLCHQLYHVLQNQHTLEQQQKVMILQQNRILQEQYLQKRYQCLKDNKIFEAPLFIQFEKRHYTMRGATFGDALMTISDKNYWYSKIGHIYVVKYLCQVCGQAPPGFGGHKIYKMYKWAQTILNVLVFSLQILEFALKVAGVPNGVSAVGDVAVNVFGGDTREMVEKSLKSLEEFFYKNSMSATHLEQMRFRIERELKKWEHLSSHVQAVGEKEEVTLEDIKQSEMVLDLNYVNAVNELFNYFKEEDCGLIRVTRLSNLDVAWVCKEGDCQKCFMRTGRVLLRYKIEESFAKSGK